MQGVTRQLAELPDDPAATVANVDFPLVLRGYHRDAVDEYVRRAAQLVATVYARRSPEGAMRGPLERAGEQVSSILVRAHESAESVTFHSRAQAEERLMQARAEAEELERDAHALADQLQRESERKAREREQAAEIGVHEVQADVDRIRAEWNRMVGDLRKLADELSELAGITATRFPAATADQAAVARGAYERHGSLETEPEVPAAGEPESSAGAGRELAGEETEMPSGSEAPGLEIPAALPDDVRALCRKSWRGGASPADG